MSTATVARPTSNVPTSKRERRAREMNRSRPLWGVVAWIVGVLFVLPVLWMVLTSLHSEPDAATNPPSIAAALTLDGYRAFFAAQPAAPLINSAMASVISTLIVLALAIPAAFALSIRPVEKWTDVMFFFLSTKFMPLVAGLLPLYLFATEVGMLDNIWLLVLLYTSMNLPIAVWMMRSFFMEVPKELLEAASIDGASLWTSVREVILPLISPGIAATALICVIFSWNEFFFAVNMTAVNAQTMPVFLTGFMSGQGLFWAQLSAASVLAALPVVICGWIAQNKLVRGLSFGAIK